MDLLYEKNYIVGGIISLQLLDSHASWQTGQNWLSYKALGQRTPEAGGLQLGWEISYMKRIKMIHVGHTSIWYRYK